MALTGLLDKTNVEVTNVTIPQDEKLENVDLFLKLMGKKLKGTKNADSKTVIQSLNDLQITIMGTRNEPYAMAKQLHWKMHRVNPKS